MLGARPDDIAQDVEVPIREAIAPVRFDLGVITVDPEVEGFDPSSLTGYYDKLGVPWHYERQPIMEEAKASMDGDSFCAY